jgi:hypothetical protein
MTGVADRSARTGGRRVADGLTSVVEAGGGEVVAVRRGAAGGAGVVRLEVLPGYVAAETAGASDAGLARVGWRIPAAADRPWRQYVYPQRRRDHRAIGDWVEATLREAHGADGALEVLTKPRDGDPPVVFAGPAAAPTADDLDLLSRTQSVLSTAGFPVRRCDAHLEATPARRHLRSHLCVSVVRGTVSVNALHLVEPEREAVAGHLGVSSTLDAAPFTYALRALAGGGRALCLQAKLRPPAPLLALALWSMIEPLLASQRRLRASRRR